MPSAATAIMTLSSRSGLRMIAQQAIDRLDSAVDLHGAIAGLGIDLADQTNTYQANWRDAMADLLASNGSDYDYLNLLA